MVGRGEVFIKGTLKKGIFKKEYYEKSFGSVDDLGTIELAQEKIIELLRTKYPKQK
ncbi:TPA: hypothetical protein H1016_03520 [archaeon]|uniref:Uncharacterized protein n=1 Tax=Candidatus Naiadarchaeum limnaeum TaxID=2756139 RepID=A0A832V1U2_9ARCH|nr:hypothetical protein [Candidatus Naiadarchaeum limnaeum]